MEKKLRVWSIVGVFITFALAGGWHFLYEVLPCGVIGAVAPVNESPWEHAKLFFMPALIWYIVLYFIAGKRFPNFIFAYSLSLFVMPALMLLLYTIYLPFLGESLAANLINSFVSFAVGALIAYKITRSKRNFSSTSYRIAALLIVLVLLAVFIVFTFWPPHSGLFWDPSNQLYGMPPA